MTVRVNKSSFNIREKLSELGRKFGLKGSEVVAAETLQQIRDLISAGRKNILINGAMQHSQRGTSFTHTTTAQYTLDRFQASNGSSFNWNSAVISQSSDSPEGFANSLKVDVASTSTPTGGHNGLFKYHVEAHDLQQLGFGTSAAKSFTLSFWVKSNKIGTYTVQIYQSDADKYLLSEYSISSSSTWEYKTLTFVGNTADVIDNNNGVGFEVRFNLACGPSDHTTAKATWTAGGGGTIYATSNQVNLFDNASNEWYMTGVQLEVGRNATDFEHRSYGEELALCQRYCQLIPNNGASSRIAMGTWSSATTARVLCWLKTTMRDTPTVHSVPNRGRMLRESINWYDVNGDPDLPESSNDVVVFRFNNSIASSGASANETATWGNGAKVVISADF